MLLVIAISSTGIISALTILIEDKKNEVAILRTIGLRSSQIASIFFFRWIYIFVSGSLWLSDWGYIVLVCAQSDGLGIFNIRI